MYPLMPDIIVDSIKSSTERNLNILARHLGENYWQFPEIW
jgi:hypothetical protein